MEEPCGTQDLSTPRWAWFCLPTGEDNSLLDVSRREASRVTRELQPGFEDNDTPKSGTPYLASESWNVVLKSLSRVMQVKRSEIEPGLWIFETGGTAAGNLVEVDRVRKSVSYETTMKTHKLSFILESAKSLPNSEKRRKFMFYVRWLNC